MKATSTPQPEPTEPRPRRVLSVARTLSLRLLVRATIACLFASLVAWLCAMNARSVFDQGSYLLEGHHAQGTFYYRMIGVFRGGFGVAEARIDFEHPRDTPQRTMPSKNAYALQEIELYAFTNHSTRWILREAPVPPDSLEAVYSLTRACGYPFKMYRSISIAHRSSRPATFVYTPDMWPNTLARTAIIEPHSVIELIMLRGRPFVYLNWGHFPTDALPSFIQSRFAHNPNLPAHIPIAPYWPGLLTNTAIYTAIIWFLCWTFATTRRAIHRWRNPNANPCKHCHYDLTGITQAICPECGRPTAKALSPDGGSQVE